jgi:hypothetical protein
MILDQLLAYIRSYTEGKVTQEDFSATMFHLRDIVEYTNAILDGTCAGLLNEDQLRAEIKEYVLDNYKALIA